MTTLAKCIHALLLAATVGFAAAAEPSPAPAAGIVRPAAEPAGRIVAGRLAELMEKRYVFPDIGTRYAATLRGKAAAGEYDALTGEDLGKRLLADLEATHPDAHLNVKPDLRPAEGSPAAGGDDGLEHVERHAPDMEEARWIAPGVAFVRYNLFPGSPANIQATEEFLDRHGDARAIVFDLRAHRGGGLGETDAIFGRLVAEPTRLLTMATRRSLVEVVGMPPTDNPRLRLVEGDPEYISLEHWALPAADRSRIKARVYVLTSGRTASAAEHFALAMKVTGLGTLVGAPTRGANHFGDFEALTEGLVAFIPFGRTFDPKTGRDWERTGVAPDIVVAAEDALATVLEREGVDAAKARALADELAPPALPRPGA